MTEKPIPIMEEEWALKKVWCSPGTRTQALFDFFARTPHNHDFSTRSLLMLFTGPRMSSSHQVYQTSDHWRTQMVRELVPSGTNLRDECSPILGMAYAIVLAGSGAVLRNTLDPTMLRYIFSSGENSAKLLFPMFEYFMAEADWETCCDYVVRQKGMWGDKFDERFAIMKTQPTLPQARACVLRDVLFSVHEEQFEDEPLHLQHRLNEILAMRARIADTYWCTIHREIVMNQVFGLAALNLPVLVSLVILDHGAPWLVQENVTMDRKWKTVKAVNDAWARKYVS